MTGWFLALNVTPNNAYLGVLKKNIQQHWYSYPVKKVLLDDVDTGFAWHVHCAQPSCPLWESCRCAARWTFFVLKKKRMWKNLGSNHARCACTTWLPHV